MFRKNKLAMLVGEFIGTTALTLIVLAITHSQLSLGYFIAIAAGVLMAVLTLALSDVSGAVFNPAVTIGLWTVRKLKTLQAVLYVAVQLLGGYVAWILFEYLTKVSGVKNSGTYDARTLVSEVIGTFVFTFIWAAAVYKQYNVAKKAAAIGGGLTVGAMIGSLAGAGLLNPAVALGVRQWGWLTYVAGPVLGAIIGFNLYNLLFVGGEANTDVKATDAKPAARIKPVASKTAPAKKPAAATKKAPAKKAAPAAKPAAKKAPAKKAPARKAPAKKTTNRKLAA